MYSSDDAKYEGLSRLSLAEHVVFLGTYNADPFKNKLSSWLPNLDLSGTILLVSDNCSTDGTMTWLPDLVESVGDSSALVCQDVNLGGYGNLSKNLSLMVKANWVTTLHQDDRYSHNHVQDHRAVINSTDSKLGMVYSEARSVTESGETRAYPRAHWLLGEDSDPVTVFLAHLRNHVFPFSGATFAKSALEKYPIPWHSTAFPDTEVVMKMCPEFDFKVSNGVTVEYLENPGSESHSLTSSHRDFGAFQALARVFAHPNYKLICSRVDDTDRATFASALREGIAQRFEDRTLRLLMTQMALEVTAEHMGTFPRLASELAVGYLSIGDTRAVDSLIAQGGHLAESGVDPDLRPSQEQSDKVSTATRSFLLTGFSFLPAPLRRPVFRLLLRFRFVRRRFKAWDFEWRDA